MSTKVSRFTPTPEMKVFFEGYNFVLFMIMMIVGKVFELHLSMMQGIVWAGLVLIFRVDDNKAIPLSLVLSLGLYILFKYLGLV